MIVGAWELPLIRPIVQSDFNHPDPFFKLKWELKKWERNRHGLIKLLKRAKWSKDSGRHIQELRMLYED